MKKNGTKILIGIALALILVACGVLAVYFFAGRNNSDDVISLGTDIVGEKKEENQKRTTEEETLTQKTEINFFNKKEVIPPTGVETTMTAWLLMTGVTLLLGAVFLLFGIRRKRFVA